jgi:hypothetical protein
MKNLVSQLKIQFNWVLVVYASYPKYVGVWDQEDHGSGQSSQKKIARPHLNRKKPDLVTYVCHSSEGRNLNIGVL